MAHPTAPAERDAVRTRRYLGEACSTCVTLLESAWAQQEVPLVKREETGLRKVFLDHSDLLRQLKEEW